MKTIRMKTNKHLTSIVKTSVFDPHKVPDPLKKANFLYFHKTLPTNPKSKLIQMLVLSNTI